MEMIKCLNCGSPLRPEGDHFRCDYCGNIHHKDNESKLSEKLQTLIQEERMENYYRAKRILYDATHVQYPDKDAVIKAASDVLALDDNDVLAKVYLYSHDQESSRLINFLTSLSVDAFTAKEITKWLTHPLELRVQAALVDFIRRNLKGDEQIDGLSKVEEEASKENEGFYDPNYPWDVFLCYSSSDMERVIDILNYLEFNEFQCFAAFRNLRHGRGAASNYEEMLRKAISSSKVFLFLSSKNSRKYSCDAIRVELPLLSKDLLGKPRIEYILDDYDEETPHRVKIVIKSVFDGLEWCRNKEDLVERLSEYVTYAENENKGSFLNLEKENKKLQEEQRRIAEEKQRLEKERETLAKEKEQAEKDRLNSEKELEKRERTLSKETNSSTLNYDDKVSKDFIIDNGVLLEYKGHDSDIVIPDGVTSIGDNAFRDCSFVKSVILPEGITSIGNDTFYRCNSLKSIQLKEGIISIGDRAFFGCSSLLSVSLPHSLTNIGSSAFQNCSFLERVQLGDNLVSIQDAAFQGCSSLISINLPKGLTSIGNKAFSRCRNLKTISLFDSLNYVGFAAFFGCRCEIMVKTTKTPNQFQSSFDREWMNGFKGKATILK